MEHYKETPNVKATHLNGPVDQASNVLRGDPKRAMCSETNGAPENQYGDQHLVVAYHTLLKMQTKTTVSPCMNAFPTLQEDHVNMGTGKAFIHGLRE